MRQRDVLPAQPGRTHIDGDAAFRGLAALQQPAAGLDHQRLGARVGHHQGGDTARAVAAGARFGAVGVEDAHEHVGARALRRLDHQQLVEADAAVTVGDAAGLVGMDRDRPLARVQHDEVVAQPVHLPERQPVHRPLPGLSRSHMASTGPAARGPSPA